MKKSLIALFIISTTFYTGCVNFFSDPFKSNTFVVKEGYLTIGKINENLKKQLPLGEKVGNNEIKLTNVVVYGGSDKKSLIVEADFIFTSFEIPEGLPAIATFKSGIDYDPRTQEFRFNDIVLKKIKFLKESLVEYINPRQRDFILDALTQKLAELILHKSKKRLSSIKGFEVKEGKIKVFFK
jgi:hypothetical protein